MVSGCSRMNCSASPRLKTLSVALIERTQLAPMALAHRKQPARVFAGQQPRDETGVEGIAGPGAPLVSPRGGRLAAARSRPRPARSLPRRR